MFSELVVAALKSSDPNLGYNIIFINDWDAHLSALLPSGAFDLGFPWHLPDCSDLSNLSPANARRCTDYDASDPFFEAVIGFYSRPDSPYAAATSLDALQGARICRPEGWFTFDLEAAELADNLTAGRIPTTCWQDLKEGKVDVVTYDAFTAEEDIVTLGMRDLVTDISGLSSVATMHVLAPKSNPNGRAYLDLLNAGLQQMRSNGQWFAIVSKHLSAHGQKVSGN
jgi:polar amino acid transport system substrate-binding protein